MQLPEASTLAVWVSKPWMHLQAMGSKHATRYVTEAPPLNRVETIHHNLHGKVVMVRR